jgi:WD40 repeat protein
LPDGSGLVTTSEDGVIRIVDLQEVVRGRIGAHGAAAPFEHEDVSISEQLRTERAKLRREQDRGSSVIKDVLVDQDEDGKLIIVSCGFDKTVKVTI